MNGQGFYEWNLMVREFGRFDGCAFNGFGGSRVPGSTGLALRARFYAFGDGFEAMLQLTRFCEPANRRTPRTRTLEPIEPSNQSNLVTASD